MWSSLLCLTGLIPREFTSGREVYTPGGGIKEWLQLQRLVTGPPVP